MEQVEVLAVTMYDRNRITLLGECLIDHVPKRRGAIVQRTNPNLVVCKIFVFFFLDNDVVVRKIVQKSKEGLRVERFRHVAGSPHVGHHPCQPDLVWRLIDTVEFVPLHQRNVEAIVVLVFVDVDLVLVLVELVLLLLVLVELLLVELLLANLCQGLASKVADASTVEVVVFPPFPYLSTAISMLEGTGIKVGAQNCALQTSGAHTGEVAVSMIRSLGCDYVLLGHSERRSIYAETENDINTKVHLCLEEDPNLGVILCVGETEEEYDSGLLRSIVDVQIKKGLSKVTQTDLSRIVIAYEPVWAIGTGKVATPEQAQIAHEAVRQTLADMFGAAASQAVRIQYGGSVTPESIDNLMIMPDVDGALVGGASLSADSFARIVGDGAAAGL